MSRTKLQRQTFCTSRLLEYFSEKELDRLVELDPVTRRLARIIHDAA